MTGVQTCALPISNLHPLYVRHLVSLALCNIATEMADVQSFEEMVGTREAAAVATESGGAMATESGGPVATESGGDRVQRGGNNRRCDG